MASAIFEEADEPLHHFLLLDSGLSPSRLIRTSDGSP